MIENILVKIKVLTPSKSFLDSRIDFENIICNNFIEIF